jgi:hypothetical protein
VCSRARDRLTTRNGLVLRAFWNMQMENQACVEVISATIVLSSAERSAFKPHASISCILLGGQRHSQLLVT